MGARPFEKGLFVSDTTEVNYKDTINLLDTTFPMKGDLPIKEPLTLQRWKERGIYQKMIARRQNAPVFSFPDGPPYANGNLHMGHALNKILKDFVVKYKNMSGYKAVFIPGWDCHGLPIEQAVTKSLGGEKLKAKSEAEIRDLCRQEARKWVNTQREQFIRYGVMGDWDNPYLTMDPGYEAEEIRVLAKVLKTGTFYRGEKPVYWCPTLQTALAEAEVEYQEVKDPSIYVKFPLVKGLEKFPFQDKPISFVIWTTTPWTLPANLAISVHPDFEYRLFDTGSEYLVFASVLRENFEQTTGIHVEPKGTALKGASLEYMETQHPFINRTSVVILGDHVTADAGTGCVHTAPGHGQDDYIVGLKYKLPILSPVDARGCYTSEVPEYQGLKIWDANPKIIERLRSEGKLLHVIEITHTYPHNWRTKTPLIFRATPQWFLAMDQSPNSIREQALEAIEKVHWLPSWGKNRITGMIANRPDWCLSRQRIWGVPIPVFYCSSCEKELAESTVMERVADAMENNGGIEAYHTLPTEEFTHGFSCSQCGNTSFKRGRDILDVWFDSGVCFAAVQKKRDGLTSPADLYLEGSDQHRGWFHTSLLASIAADGQPPYKTVLTHGFVMYAKGQKMSKSVGNVVNPQDLIAKNGAEILRLWAAHEDYAQDLTCSPESFQRITETYRRLRNTIRFLLGNTSDFNPATDCVPYANLKELDQWALFKVNDLVKTVTAAYDAYEFYKVYHALNNFVTVELSAVYLDILKDRLYTSKKMGVSRRAAQTVLHEIVLTLTGLMAPVLSFLAEETYQHLGSAAPAESVFLTDFPKIKTQWNRPDLGEKYETLLRVRSDVSKVLEDLRKNKTIGASLEAKLTITADATTVQTLRSIEPELPGFFIVSQVDLKDGAYAVEAQTADGTKCARCWSYNTRTNENPKFPNVCPKCVEALQ